MARFATLLAVVLAATSAAALVGRDSISGTGSRAARSASSDGNYLSLVQVHSERQGIEAPPKPKHATRAAVENERARGNALESMYTGSHTEEKNSVSMKVAASKLLLEELKLLPVDVSPEQAVFESMLTRKLNPNPLAVLLMPLPRQRRFRLLRFAMRAYERNMSGVDASQASLTWTLWFFLGLVIMGCFTWFFCDRLQVGPSHSAAAEDEGNAVAEAANLARARGQPWWTHMCILSVLGLCTAVFWSTVTSIEMVNAHTQLHPEYYQYAPDGSIMTVTRYPISQPAKNGFESGQGVAFSAAMASILTFGWRYQGALRANAALLAQFAMRGATLSLVIAVMLEILGEYLLTYANIDAAEGATFGNLFMMIIVGASEEGAKLFAVVVCTVLTTSALERSRGGYCNVYTLLVENPRTLMLAALAVGFGFCINENAEYMISTACQPPMKYTYADDAVGKVGEGSLQTVMIFTVLVRVLLNIHPWWTGISAARLGSLAFSPERDGQALPTTLEFLWAIWPSAAAHASYDFIVSSGLPGMVAIMAPPGFWYASRWVFQDLWQKFEVDKLGGGETGGVAVK